MVLCVRLCVFVCGCVGACGWVWVCGRRGQLTLTTTPTTIALVCGTATGTPTIVVVISGRPLATPWVADNVAALLYAWVPGEQGGAAIADMLLGRAQPGGRLPMTIPRHVGQVPCYYNRRPGGQQPFLWGAYADGPASPLFPFGHGLSYSRFAYTDFCVAGDALCAPSPRGVWPSDQRVVVTVTVANVGDVDADEVVQLYASLPLRSVTRPVRQLVAFKRVHVESGGRVSLHINVPASKLLVRVHSVSRAWWLCLGCPWVCVSV